MPNNNLQQPRRAGQKWRSPSISRFELAGCGWVGGGDGQERRRTYSPLSTKPAVRKNTLSMSMRYQKRSQQPPPPPHPLATGPYGAPIPPSSSQHQSTNTLSTHLMDKTHRIPLSYISAFLHVGGSGGWRRLLCRPGGKGKLAEFIKRVERGGWYERSSRSGEMWRCGVGDRKKRGKKENPPGRGGGDKGFKRKESDRIDGLGGEEINRLIKK